MTPHDLRNIKVALLATLLILPATMWADASKETWLGSWAMNHDGHRGTLRIVGTKADCNTSAWCDMALSYVDGDGALRRGQILSIDDRGQHMAFQINFPGNPQRFDAYIFSWQNNALAGTTSWKRRTFGFYATK